MTTTTTTKRVRDFIADERARIAELNDADAWAGSGLHSGGRLGELALLDRLEATLGGADKTPAERYAEGLQKVNDAGPYASHGYRFYADRPGRFFTRVVEDTGNQHLVHAFVENATGAVYKAESWKRPAKGARFATVDAALAAMGDRVGTFHLYR